VAGLHPLRHRRLLIVSLLALVILSGWCFALEEGIDPAARLGLAEDSWRSPQSDPGLPSLAAGRDELRADHLQRRDGVAVLGDSALRSVRLLR
jgi:hypothetical protein